MAHGANPHIVHGRTDQRCYLLELPTELRVRIYEFVYDGRCECRINITTATNAYSYDSYARMTDDPIQDMPLYGLSLLRTCRTTLREARPVVYERTEFAVHISHESSEHAKAPTAQWNIPSVVHTLTKLSVLSISAIEDPEDPAGRLHRIGMLRSCTDATFSALSSSEPIEVEWIELTVYGVDTDAIALGLLDLSCEPGAKMRIELLDGKISPGVRDEVVEKLELSEFDPD